MPTKEGKAHIEVSEDLKDDLLMLKIKFKKEGKRFKSLNDMLRYIFTQTGYIEGKKDKKN